MITTDPISHLRQLTDTAIASQRPADALAVDQSLRLLEAEELLACSERRVSIGRYIKGGASEENLAKLRLWVAEAKRTQRTTDFDMVRSCLTIIEAEETLAKVAERAQRREQVKVLPPGYEYANTAHDMFAAPPPGHEWTDDSKVEVREVHRHGTGPARPLAHAWSVYMGCEDPPGFCSRDALDAGEVNSIVVARSNAWAKFKAAQNCDFFFQAPDGRVFGPYCNKASMHGDAWVHATDPDLFIAPTPGADELLTPEEYEAALACEVSDTEIYNTINQTMQEALALRAQFFRVSVPRVALERAKAMLVKWDVQESPKPTMREGAVYLAHLKVSPRVPAFEVFLIGDLVVVAEDANNAARVLFTASETNTKIPLAEYMLRGVVPRQVDSSEVLTVYLWDDGPHTETRGTSVTKTAGDWARSSGRGVLGPLDGSQLAQRVGDEGRLILCSTDTQIGRNRPAPREHKPRCNGVPCYCDDEVLVTDGTYFDAARENHLYFIGPNLYVAESEEAALQHHCDSVVDSKRKLEEMRRSIRRTWSWPSSGIEDAPSVAELASVHIDAMIVEVNKDYEVRRIAEDETLPDIVELSDEESVQTSPKSYDEWRRGKVGSVGLLRSYWMEVVTPHVAALMEAAGVAGERRLQEVRGKLGIENLGRRP